MDPMSACIWTASSKSTSASGIESVSPNNSSIKSLCASSLLEVLGIGLEEEGVEQTLLPVVGAGVCVLPTGSGIDRKSLGKISLPVMGHDLYSSGFGGFSDF